MKKIFVVFMMFINLVAVSACKSPITNIALPEIKQPINVSPAPVSLPVTVAIKEITINANLPMNIFFCTAAGFFVYKMCVFLISDIRGKKVSSLGK